MFHEDDFKPYLGTEQSKMAAQVANTILNQNGNVLFGEIFEDKDGKMHFVNFTSKKEAGDTHTTISIGVSAMRAFAPLADTSRIQVDGPTSVQKARAETERLAQLEADNEALKRGKK
jgi:hypothetical protein